MAKRLCGNDFELVQRKDREKRPVGHHHCRGCYFLKKKKCSLKTGSFLDRDIVDLVGDCATALHIHQVYKRKKIKK